MWILSFIDVIPTTHLHASLLYVACGTHRSAVWYSMKTSSADMNISPSWQPNNTTIKNSRHVEQHHDRWIWLTAVKAKTQIQPITGSMTRTKIKPEIFSDTLELIRHKDYHTVRLEKYIHICDEFTVVLTLTQCSKSLSFSISPVALALWRDLCCADRNLSSLKAEK